MSNSLDPDQAHHIGGGGGGRGGADLDPYCLQRFISREH